MSLIRKSLQINVSLNSNKLMNIEDVKSSVISSCNLIQLDNLEYLIIHDNSSSYLLDNEFRNYILELKASHCIKGLGVSTFSVDSTFINYINSDNLVDLVQIPAFFYNSAELFRSNIKINYFSLFSARSSVNLAAIFDDYRTYKILVNFKTIGNIESNLKFLTI
jgi:predicted aldo/keto reductase-like oxidoreductase